MTQHKIKEPECRVCRCTEHNACEEGCSWVKVGKGEAPLCSACSGTARDLCEAMGRIITFQLKSNTAAAKQAVAIGRAADRRHTARVKAEANVVDASWGTR